MKSMLRKHLILTSALCAGLALVAPGALAQKQGAAASLIQPKGGWAVTRIGDTGTQGGAYCTLARQYQNGVILSIGRNQAEEYSVAVDFQTAKLDPDKPYDLTMKAGNQTRQLQMMAASPRAMVVRLGWDDSFFEALEKSQTFSITMNKESYSFALPEYAKGKSDLAGCMNELKDTKDAKTAGGTDVLAAESGIGGAGFSATKTAENAAPATPAAKAKPDATKRPQETAIVSLDSRAVPRQSSEDKAAYVAPIRSADADSLSAENAKLRSALDEQRRAYEAKMAENDQTNQVAELREKLRLAEMKGGSAPAIVPAPVPVPAPAVKEVVKPDPAQAQKITALEKQVTDLNAQLAARTDVTMKPMTTPLPNPEQAKRIADLQREVDTLKAQSKALPAARPEDAAKIAELEKARETYAARITDLQKQLAGVRQAKAAPVPVTPAALPAPDAEAQRLAAENAALKTALQDRNQELADLNTKLTSAAKPVAVAPAPVPIRSAAQDSSAPQQVAVLQAELQKKDALVRSAQERTAAQDDQISNLRRQVGQLQRQAGADVTPAETDRLKRDNDALRNRVAEQQDTFQRKLAAVEEQQQVPRGPAAMPDQMSPAAAAPQDNAAGLKAMLAQAGIAASNDAKRPSHVVDAYQWRSGAIAGRAQAMEGAGNALDVSQAYANAQRSACHGDFASVPGTTADGRVSLDIACVDGNGGRAQSLLFAQQGGQVLAFILESPAEDMDQAMDQRDQLGKQL